MYTEYNSEANVSDESCLTLIVYGCTDSDYIDFDSTKYNNIKTHFSPTAAKLWYFILVNNEIQYRFEIRSKGDWDNSPQLLIHNIKI